MCYFVTWFTLIIFQQSVDDNHRCVFCSCYWSPAS
jgi:hypothetical protein